MNTKSVCHCSIHSAARGEDYDLRDAGEPDVCQEDISAPSAESIQVMLDGPRGHHPRAELFTRLAGEALRLERRPVDRSIDILAARQSFAEYMADFTGHRLSFVQECLAKGWTRTSWLMDDEEQVFVRDLIARHKHALIENRAARAA